MVELSRVRVTWTGLTALPGLSTFYVEGATPDLSAIKAFYTSLAGRFPSPLSWTIPNSGDTIDAATGTLTGGWVGTGGGTVAATSVGERYAAGVGVLAVWDTNGIAGGRRVRGRTFLAPIGVIAYDLAGTIDDTILGQLRGYVSTLAASTPTLQIWHRPVGGAGGQNFAVTSGSVPDRVTSLRSRRY